MIGWNALVLLDWMFDLVVCVLMMYFDRYWFWILGFVSWVLALIWIGCDSFVWLLWLVLRFVGLYLLMICLGLGV